MSTQHNNSNQSLQVKVFNRIDIHPLVSARYRLFNLENINTGQERRRHVDHLVVQRTVMGGTLKASLIKMLLVQKWCCIPISRDQVHSDVQTMIMYNQNLTVGGKVAKCPNDFY